MESVARAEFDASSGRYETYATSRLDATQIVVARCRAGGVAGILTFVRSLKQAKAQQGVTVDILIEAPGGPALPVEQADAALLARLLGQPDGQ